MDFNSGSMRAGSVVFNWKFCLFLAIVTILFSYTSLKCRQNYNNNTKPLCKPRSQTFGFAGMQFCHNWLTCEDLKNITKRELFLNGIVKRIFKSEWNGYDILISEVATPELEPDFNHHVQMLKLFSPSPFVVQAIGFCEIYQVMTEYHPLGSALNAQLLPPNMHVRFGLCLSYARILNFLHNHPSGTYVMCDSSTLSKTLSQYLLTDDLQLVVADLDALPTVRPPEGIVCGHRELNGDFVAPEQKWTFDVPFNDSLMIPYDEKSDIWKIPDVCDWFLGESSQADVLRFHLFSIHRKCKDLKPELRPSIETVLKEYQKHYLELQ